MADPVNAATLVAATAANVGAVTVTRLAPASMTMAASCDGFTSRPMVRCQVLYSSTAWATAAWIATALALSLRLM